MESVILKAAIIYYSLEGNTELVANMISEKTGAELIKLEPKEEIPKEGFKKFIWGGKSVMFKEKPELLNGQVDLTEYDTLIFGTPIWAGGFTPPMLTFLTNSTIKNKRIFLFACNKGGSSEKCFTNFKEHLKGNEIMGTIDFKEPKSADGKTIEEKVDGFCKLIK